MPPDTVQTMRGSLYLIPNIIHPNTENEVIAPIIFEVIKDLDYYLAENLRTARRYLSSLMKHLPAGSRKTIADLQFEILNKDTNLEEILHLLQPVKEGRSGAILSESGCPGIADPGSMAVKLAHQLNIQVVPLPGPSSIYMALMSSGMNGQSFAFHGYLPVKIHDLKSQIRVLEKDARRFNQTQIFIETPYRNQRLFETLLMTCSADTQLCLALDITGPNSLIKTQSISKWKTDKIHLPKAPAVFLLSA